MPPENRIKKIQLLTELGDNALATVLTSIFDTIQGSTLRTSLDTMITFPNNPDKLGWLGTKPELRPKTRALILMTALYPLLNDSRDASALRRTAPAAELTIRNTATRLPIGTANKTIMIPEATYAFNRFNKENQGQIPTWFSNESEWFREQWNTVWRRKFDATAVEVAQQAREITQLQGQVRQLRVDLDSLETKVKSLEASHLNFKTAVDAQLQLVNQAQANLTEHVRATVTKFEESLKVAEDKIEDVNKTVVRNVKDVKKALEELGELRSRAAGLESSDSAQNIIIAGLEKAISALSRDYVEQSGLVAETAVATWVTMETLKLHIKVTEKIFAASEKLALLDKAKEAAKKEYEEMLTTANWQEALALKALDGVLYVAELATPLPFNSIVRLLRKNRSLVIGTGLPEQAIPPEEGRSSGDQDQDTPNIIDAAFTAGRSRADAQVDSITSEIDNEKLKADVEAEVGGVLDDIETKGKAVVRKFIRIPLITVGWRIPVSVDFTDALEEARQETVSRLKLMVEDAVTALLNRKKLRVAVQAAYWADGGQTVGGVSAKEIATRVFNKMTEQFTPVWDKWDEGLEHGLSDVEYKKEAEKVFLYLFIGHFVESNFAATARITTPRVIGALPQPLVVKLKKMEIIKDDEAKSELAYANGYIPWRTSVTKSNTNHALMVWAVFRRFLQKPGSHIRYLFNGLGENCQKNFLQLIPVVGAEFEGAKEDETYWLPAIGSRPTGRKRVPKATLQKLFPKASPALLDQYAPNQGGAGGGGAGSEDA